MNKYKVIFSIAFVFCLGSLFIPLFSHAQTTPPQNTGNGYTVTGATTNQEGGEEEAMGSYKFIAPIEPLVSGLIDPTTKLADLKDDNSLKNYVRAWFKFLVGVGSILAVIRLVHAGFGIITGASKAGAHSKVRDELVAIITSVLLIAGSWVFLYTINPSLVATDLFVKTLSIEPYELMVQKEPTTPGYWFKFKELETGKIQYRGPFLHNNYALVKDSAINNAANVGNKWAARALVLAAYSNPITLPFAWAFGLSKAWDYDCSIDAGSYNVKTKVQTLPGTHSETMSDEYGGTYEIQVKNSTTTKVYEVYMSEDSSEEGWCFWLPRGTKPEALTQSSEKEQSTRNTLASSGINVNKNACVTLSQRSCTSVGGLDPTTIAHIQNLASTVSRANCAAGKTGCPVIVTGGSEPNGHVSHGDGFTFDLGFNATLEAEMQKNATYIAPGYRADLPRYLWNGYWYADEKNEDGSNHHFHVCKYRATGSNLHMCGPVWGPSKGAKFPLECEDAPGNPNQKLCRTRKTNVICPTALCKKAAWKDPKLMTETYVAN